MVQLYWVGATGRAATVLVGAMGWCYRHALQLWVAKEPRHTAQDVDSKTQGTFCSGLRGRRWFAFYPAAAAALFTGCYALLAGLALILAPKTVLGKA